MPALTVRYSYPTIIPGYEPSWVAYEGDDWGEAYTAATNMIPVIGKVAGASDWTADYETFWVALRDGEAARMEVWSRRQYVELGRPFERRLLGTIWVVA